MKNTLSLILPVLLFLSVGCKQTDGFRLTAEVDGLEVGDTIFIESVLLPLWETEYTDTLFVSEKDKFEYTKQLAHTSLLFLNYSPQGKSRLVSPIRAASVLAAAKDHVIVKGNTDYFALLDKDGDFYLDSLVARYNSLKNENDRKRIDIFRKFEVARIAQQQDSANEYMKQYQSYKTEPELDTLEKQLRDEVHNSEYSAYLYLSRLYRKKYEEVKRRFEEFTPEIQQSYMGGEIEKMLKILKNIEVGNTPNSFTVTDINGNKISLADYKGKYLLLYHWGWGCPGTAWVHPKLLNLYDKYHQKGFDILGFSSHVEQTMQAIDKVVEQFGPESVGKLNEQPWTTVDVSKDENEFVKKDLYFSGVPILMLVSPEGETLARGYTDVYQEVKKTLEENLK